MRLLKRLICWLRGYHRLNYYTDKCIDCGKDKKGAKYHG